jgi:hypothetical protein
MELKTFKAMKGKATTAIRRLFVLILKRLYDCYLIIFEALRRGTEGSFATFLTGKKNAYYSKGKGIRFS